MRVCAGWCTLPDYDVTLEVKNTSPERKANWPVVMTIYKVFGRNLPAGTLNPEGYHVYDAEGREVPHMIEAIHVVTTDGWRSSGRHTHSGVSWAAIGNGRAHHRASTAVMLRPREWLVRQDDPATAFFIVIDGWVKLYRSTRGTRR